MSETFPRLVLVTPNSEHQMFHSWLASDRGMDRVHRIANSEELMRKRLGDQDSNKRTYALVNENFGLLSVIYTYATQTPVADETWKMLPGEISPILEAPSEKMEEDPNVIVFYSISSFENGSGRPLIKSIYDEFTRVSAGGHVPILTTLSPLRTFSAWLQREGHQYNGTEEARLQRVADYLKTTENPVRNFHLGNGAQVGAIHLNAAPEGTVDGDSGAGVMISYRYPRRQERLAENQRILNSGRVPASYHLSHFFK